MTLEVSTKRSRGNPPRPGLERKNTLAPRVSTKALLVWGGLIAVSSIPLSAIHHNSDWWLILVFGVVLPIALGLANRIANGHKGRASPHPAKHGEKELLEVLEREGELTPVAAATKTTLTVSEADRMLSELAQKGYLEVRADGGKISYAPWERNRQESVEF